MLSQPNVHCGEFNTIRILAAGCVFELMCLKRVSNVDELSRSLKMGILCLWLMTNKLIDHLGKNNTYRKVLLLNVII